MEGLGCKPPEPKFADGVPEAFNLSLPVFKSASSVQDEPFQDSFLAVALLGATFPPKHKHGMEALGLKLIT